MALWGEWGASYANQIRTSLSGIYRPEYIHVLHNNEDGYCVQIEASDQLRLLVVHKNSKGWIMEFFKMNKDGSRTKNFNQHRVVLVSSDQSFPGHSQVVDAFVTEFESLLSQEPNLSEIYSEDALARFRRSIRSYWQLRSPMIQKERERVAEMSNNKAKQKEFEGLFVGFLIGFFVLGILVWLVNQA